LEVAHSCCHPAYAITAPKGQFGADDRLDPRGERGLVEPRGAVHAVAIQQRERRVAERRRALDERFGQRCALQKTER
jgi:hypothetical protein